MSSKQSHPRRMTMAINPHFRPAGPHDLHVSTPMPRAALPNQSAEHMAVERAIRGLRASPISHRHAVVADLPPDVTIASVLKNFADLREAVSVLARSLRDQGIPPERMLPQIKIAVTDVIQNECWKDRTVEQLVMENVVRWSIDAYYAD